MKSLYILMGIGLLVLGWGYSVQVEAQTPGDVGSPACRTVQQAAQVTVASGGRYKNHGKLVSTAAKVVGAAEDAGTITEACSSCIVSQFARRIPINEQNFCGPHCGDRVVQAALGEACDDGNTINGDGCSDTCQIEGPAPSPCGNSTCATTCGDGICESGEDILSPDTFCAVDCGCGAFGQQNCGIDEEAPGYCFCDIFCVEDGDCCPDACAVCGQC
jgi:cysteine-rich repeat protein